MTLAWYSTSAFSMLMENTGVIGHWWTWAMPSWWYFPNMVGAPLVDLPWERPITDGVGLLHQHVLVHDARHRPAAPVDPARLLVLLGGLAALLELSRVTLFMSFWALVLMPGLPFLSIRTPPRPAAAVPREFRARSASVAPGGTEPSRRASWRWSASACSRSPSPRSGSPSSPCFPSWPSPPGSTVEALWVDCLVSLAFVLVGYALNNGNLILAGWLVLRCSLVLWGAVVLLRRTTRVDEAPRGEVAAA